MDDCRATPPSPQRSGALADWLPPPRATAPVSSFSPSASELSDGLRELEAGVALAAYGALIDAAAVPERAHGACVAEPPPP